MNKEIRKVTNVVFKAVGLAMGVAVVVLSQIAEMEMESMFTLVGIGIACLGIAALSKES